MKICWHETENPTRKLNQISSYWCTEGFATTNTAYLRHRETTAPDSNKWCFWAIISYFAVDCMNYLSFLSCILCPNYFYLIYCLTMVPTAPKKKIQFWLLRKKHLGSAFKSICSSFKGAGVWFPVPTSCKSQLPVTWSRHPLMVSVVTHTHVRVPVHTHTIHTHKQK